MLTLFLLGVGQHFECGVFEIKDSTQVEGYDTRPRFIKLQPDLVSKLFGVREKHSPLGPQYQQTGKGFIFGMFVRAGPKHVRTRLSPENMQPWIRNLVSKGHDGRNDRYDDSLQRPNQHDTRKGGQRPDELGAADLQNLEKLRGLDQAHRVDNDDGCQSRL